MASKTPPQLTSLPSVGDNDLVVVWNGSGPLKKATASTFRSYLFPSAFGFQLVNAADAAAARQLLGIARPFLWSDITTVTVPAGLDLIQSSGCISVGVGDAKYSYIDPSTPGYGSLTPNRWRQQSANGRWYQLAEDIVFPQMFQAVGDADDTDAVQACLDFPAKEKHAVGEFQISRSLAFEYVTGRVKFGAARLTQNTARTSVASVCGSQGDFDPPIFATATVAGETDNGSVGVVFPYGPVSGMRGFYWNSVGAIRTESAAVGIFVPPAITSTLNGAVSGGSSTIVVTNAQTDVTGTYPWVAGLYVTITLADTTTHTSRVNSVALDGVTFTLREPLPSAANNGAAVVVPQSTFHSNAIKLIKTVKHAFAHTVVRAASTQNAIDQMYANNDPSQTADPSTSVYIHYWTSFNDMAVASMNLEWSKFKNAALFVGGGQTCRINSLHTEGLRFAQTGRGLVEFSQQSLDVGAWVIDDLAVMTSDIGAGSVALIRPLHSSGPGYGRFGSIVAKNGLIQGALWMTIDGSTGTGRPVIDIDNYVDIGDAGINVIRQFQSPDAQPIIRNFGNVLPDGCLGYCRHLSIQGTVGTRRAIYLGRRGNYLLTGMKVFGGQTTAAAGSFRVYDASAAGTELTNGADVAMTTLTGSGFAIDVPFAAATLNRVFVGDSFPRLWWNISASQSSPAAVSVGASGTRSFTAKGAFYMLRTIAFSAPHGFVKGQEVLVAGSANTEYNGTYRLIGVTSTTISYYKYGAGAAETNVADTGITVQGIPYVDVYAYGVRTED